MLKYIDEELSLFLVSRLKKIKYYCTLQATVG